MLDTISLMDGRRFAAASAAFWLASIFLLGGSHTGFDLLPEWTRRLISVLILPAGLVYFWMCDLRNPRWLQRARRNRGLCPACGYDLRATPDKCPECGAAPDKRIPGSAKISN